LWRVGSRRPTIPSTPRVQEALPPLALPRWRALSRGVLSDTIVLGSLHLCIRPTGAGARGR